MSTAFYRCEVKVISRSAGRSATAAAAYRAAELIMDSRTGEQHDYRRRRGVEHTEIVLPEGAPAELQDRTALWNAAEEAERRKNARVAREVLLSMPDQLSEAEQRTDVARAMADWLVEYYQVATDLAVHAPDRQADERNYHAHIMLTTRRVGEDGFGEKTRELDDKAMGPEEIERIRAAWEAIGNRYLERAGHEPSLDRRSLADRGIEREPEPKLGPVASEMERAGRPSNAGDDRRAVKERNAELARLMEERKVIDLEIERARRRERSLEPSQTPRQARPDRRPELSPELFRNQTQARQHIEQERFYAKVQQDRTGLERMLDYQHGDFERQQRAEIDQLHQMQAERNRLATWWAELTGRAEQERQQAAALQATIDNIELRKAEAKSQQEWQHEVQRQAMLQQQDRERGQVEAQLAISEKPIANDQIQEPFQQAVNASEPNMRQDPEFGQDPGQVSQTSSRPGMETETDPSRESAVSQDFDQVSGGTDISSEPAAEPDQNRLDQAAEPSAPSPDKSKGGPSHGY